ncbi:nucleoside-diphosphate sugar epimerase/dehydratase [Cyclobacterium sp. 1_MG-2023]|uniref:nucleoside-diphosphate sugar epimerase/dehydratase n=1 Tax=Cyclobacterium sp. 1_MG-2023 TaxID=3062681 RepID=UPI0026E3C02C|nr:nucleoside-diphosphate sugar epimerase/dehydratase [Cyclobacterium sp. 1_MG-2023]MDO6440371.1 nucleoside-diphosphate sugar epimerase/dehydratase [Cyclobacterium sp. 1_MG-2023]
MLVSKLNPLRKFLEDDRHIHPLVILSVDILIVFISFSLAYLIIGGFGFDQIDFVQYLMVTTSICVIALPVIYFSKLHTGLLRYSNTADLFRIFLATIIFSLLFIVFYFGLGHRWIALNYSFIMLVMLVNFFITSTLLIAFRLLAKSTYLSLANKFSNKAIHKVLIFGADQNAVLVKQALSNDPDLNYVVEGFLSSDRTMLNNYLEQKKVYHMKDLPKLKKQKDIKELLITNENLNEREKRVVIERCIRLGIKVLTIPAAKNWLSGELSSKQIKKLRIEDLLQRKPIVIDQRKVKSDLEGKKVLVTGAAGSIGSEIVRQVLSYKPSLLILCDHAESPLHEVQLAMEDEFPDAKMEVVLADVSNYERMHKLFNVCRPQIVYHAAAYKHVPMIENNPFEAISVNVGGTRNIADLAVFFKVDKFVMVSTDKAVNPTNVMGASKRLAEIYTQSLNGLETCKTKFITTRFGNVLGSNGSVIPRFRSQIKKGGPITVTHPDITRYFMTIPEAVQLVLEAGTMGKGGEIYVFDMGKPIKIVDLAKKMIQLAGLEEGKDIDIVFSGLRPGEKLYEELLSSAELTVPTHHHKISIAKVLKYPYTEADVRITELLVVNKHHDNEAVVKKMKEIIPEFKSKNSIYEGLDKTG